MATTTTTTNKPLNPRAQDLSPKGYNRAALYSGKALDFDGVNDEVTTGQDLGNLQTLSVAMYCRIDNMTDGSARSPISQFNSSNGWMIYKSSGLSRLVFYRNGNSFTWDDSITFNNQWIHLAYVIEQGVGAYVYANGELVASDTSYTSNLSYSTSPTVKIGSYGNTSGGFLNGGISGTKIFNTALTAAQVSDLYLNPEKIVPDGVANSALKLWLPMMEGAGTTAYDGSGNGNHGTINGATWVSGIGAPVAQTALVSWNKGTNLVAYSEQLDNVYWTQVGTTTTANQIVSPDGYQNADLVAATNSDGNRVERAGFSLSGANTFSIFLKKGTSSRSLLIDGGKGVQIDWAVDGTPTVTAFSGGPTPNSFGSVDYGNGWCRVWFQDTYAGTYSIRLYPDRIGTTGTIYAWGASITQSSSVQPYTPTLATAQTSPVLLPQGLTANKDITGVNAFESARNPYALNLDGASWGEVHDNASLDFSSGMTLEAWVKLEDINQAILGKWNFAANKKEYLLYYNASVNNLQAFFGNGSSVQFTSISYTGDGSWVHFVGTTDGSTITPYLNGVAGTTAAQTTPLGASDIAVRIGVDNTGSGYSPNQIALPRIYNRALTATEVARNYNADKSKFGL